ncbi:MAG: efflux RND transporter periplasmic adaptor subunit [Nitrospirota bacterium]
MREHIQMANAPIGKEPIRVHREPPAPQTRRVREKRSLVRRPGVVIGITMIAIIGIIYGATVVFHSLTHQSTDDAFVDTHVVSVAPKVAGRVSAVHVRDNQFVKKDEVLLELDPRDFQVAFDQAKANLAKDKATETTAEANEQRAKSLFSNKVISAQERDANVAAAQSSRGNVQADAAAVKQAELNLAYTKIKAPIDSYVTNKKVAIGDYLQVGQTLMALVPPRVWVTANFKETQLRNMRPGQPATISVDAYPGLKLPGHVDSIQAGSGAAFSLLPPENATGNYVKVVQRVPVKIVFDQKPDGQHVLGPGMSVVPDVQIASGFGAAVKVFVGAGLIIAIVIIAAALWIGRI